MFSLRGADWNYNQLFSHRPKAEEIDDEDNKPLFKLKNKEIEEEKMSEENHVKEDGEVASPAPQSSAGFFTSSYEHEIYKKYHQYTLSKQDLIDHDYPMSDDEDRTDFVQVGNDESIPKSLAESILAIDCEMVVSEAGFQLAKISIVDFNFNSIYDHYIKPTNVITDYNTK